MCHGNYNSPWHKCNQNVQHLEFQSKMCCVSMGSGHQNHGHVLHTNWGRGANHGPLSPKPWACACTIKLVNCNNSCQVQKTCIVLTGNPPQKSLKLELVKCNSNKCLSTRVTSKYNCLACQVQRTCHVMVVCLTVQHMVKL